MSESDPDQAAAALRARVGETSLRMMAGIVPSHVVDHLQARLFAEPDDYPWEEVVDSVLDDQIPDEEAVNKGLLAHRNWLLRAGKEAAPANAVGRSAAGGARRRPKSLKVRGKTMLAVILVKGGFFLIYTFAVVLLLVLLRHKFPGFDIYRILDGLKAILPSVFGG